MINSILSREELLMLHSVNSMNFFNKRIEDYELSEKHQYEKQMILLLEQISESLKEGECGNLASQLIRLNDLNKMRITSI